MSSAPWNAEAMRLYREEGIGYKRIAKRLDLPVREVKRLFDRNRPRAGSGDHNKGRGLLTEKWSKPERFRPIAGKVNGVLMAAARAFAAGEIDRRELSKRLRSPTQEA